MSITRDDAVVLHRKAIEMLATKLAHIPNHSFFAGRKPNLDDYYRLNSAVFPSHIPKSLSLPFFFEHFNVFVSNKFSGAKFEGREQIAAATWLWCIDKNRSFSRHHSNVLVNFLLACIVEARPQDVKDAEQMEFIGKFSAAFIAYNLRVPEFAAQAEFLSFWYHYTKYDLIMFSSRNIWKVLRKVKAVKAAKGALPFRPHEFLNKAGLQDPVVFRQNALMWAVKWSNELETQFEMVDNLEKTHIERPQAVQDELSARLEAIGVDELPAYLSQEHFLRPQTQALLGDIREVDQPQEKQSVPWMGNQAALDIILNSDLSEMLASLVENLQI